MGGPMEPKAVSEIFVVGQTTEVRVTMLGVPNGTPGATTPAVFVEERELSGNGHEIQFRMVVNQVRARSLLLQVPSSVGKLHAELVRAGFMERGTDWVAESAALLFPPALPKRV